MKKLLITIKCKIFFLLYLVFLYSIKKFHLCQGNNNILESLILETLYFMFLLRFIVHSNYFFYLSRNKYSFPSIQYLTVPWLLKEIFFSFQISGPFCHKSGNYMCLVLFLKFQLSFCGLFVHMLCLCFVIFFPRYLCWWSFSL